MACVCVCVEKKIIQRERERERGERLEREREERGERERGESVCRPPRKQPHLVQQGSDVIGRGCHPSPSSPDTLALGISVDLNTTHKLLTRAPKASGALYIENGCGLRT